jgi:hypothetical protein
VAGLHRRCQGCTLTGHNSNGRSRQLQSRHVGWELELSALHDLCDSQLCMPLIQPEWLSPCQSTRCPAHSWAGRAGGWPACLYMRATCIPGGWVQFEAPQPHWLPFTRVLWLKIGAAPGDCCALELHPARAAILKVVSCLPRGQIGPDSCCLLLTVARRPPC